MKRLESIDLNLLMLLHWLLEECNVTRAANRVGLSQPAASRGLQRLREEFSDELLVRSGRGYTHSRLANSIKGDLARAVQHLRTVTHMEDVFDPSNSEDEVLIACNDYLATVCTEAWIDAITPQAPKMRSNWRPLDDSVKDALASGQIDLAIIPRAALANIPKTAVMEDMVVKPMLKDTFVVFGPTNHPVLKVDNLSLKMFAAANHVLVSPSGEGLGYIDRLLAEYDLARRISHRTFSFNHAVDLAVTTGAVTVVPERLARLKTSGGYRPLPFDTDMMCSDIVWHASRTSDKAHTWVRHQLQSYFKVKTSRTDKKILTM